jgi:hypothetical protein
MSFIYQDRNLKERRIKHVIDTLYKSITDLLVLEDSAQSLIDEAKEKQWIANHSINESDSIPLLPLGNEKVFQWTSLNFNLTSDSKFIQMIIDEEVNAYNRNRLNVLQPDYRENGETLPTDVSALTNTGLKIKDGVVIFPNLEKYDFDYESNGILNEVYRAMKIFLDSVESFYSQFYQQSILDFVDEPYNDYDDSQVKDEIILIYDTREMDDEITNVIDPIANQIDDAENREAVKLRYRQLRDNIKDFTMFTCVPRLEENIDKLLFVVNGIKKYDIGSRINNRVLIVREDNYGYKRTYQTAEEVFFPFHNKAILDSFTQGLSSIW